MDKVEFINPNSHPIQVAGPNKETITFKKFEKRVLSSWYIRYCPRYLVQAGLDGPVRPTGMAVRENKRNIPIRRSRRRIVTNTPITPKSNVRNKQKRNNARRIDHRPRRKTVGSPEFSSRMANECFSRLMQIIKLPISNNIGVGILSYNRLNCIKKLLSSIRKYTDLNSTTVFVSDESTDQTVKKWLDKQEDIVFLDNKERLGIAGNSNRLLRCLDRFEHKILLNDDVEITAKGWDKLYPALMRETGYHHFCMRQPGIFGASRIEGKIAKQDGINIQTVQQKPHGAIMAFDKIAFAKIGYFDESFGLYGMEHVDWSNRVSLSGIQPLGFHDAVGSEKFFKIHSSSSSIPSTERTSSLRPAKKKFAKISNDKKRIYIQPTPKSKVPEVACIIPFQGKDRNSSIRTVIKNIIAQRFPRIVIIAVEQDNQSRVNLDGLVVHYYFAKTPHQAFTKAIAFNVGVSKAPCPKLILHDADMIVQGDYVAKVAAILDRYESCHIGQRVLYLNAKSTVRLNENGCFDATMSVHKNVGYFEGGSLGCLKNTYFHVGGFNEDFIGYGIEDCEFFERLKELTKFCEDRTINLLHLEHGRTKGWKEHHTRNKGIYARLSYRPLGERRRMLCERLRKYQ